ncbi:MAG: tetratricopeptide repeat protein [Gammaproteobacteria bacterium]|nr:MAG: tetratricopeptide repeat protein [Gammaproteobacteria bacterium]
MNELIAIEQAEYVKKWCREYGFGILIGIFCAVFISWGWNYWHQEKENNLLIASMQYERLVASIAKGEKNSTLNNIADGLLQNYAYTPYASLAALQLAKLAVNQNNLTEAANRLVSIIDHGQDHVLQSIARLRLARILLSQIQAKEALKLLSKNEDKAYIPIFLEEKGDILSNLGQYKAALQSYLAAKQAFGNNGEQPLLEMKINNLAYA